MQWKVQEGFHTFWHVAYVKLISIFTILAPLAHPKSIYEDLKNHTFIIEQQIEKNQKYALCLQVYFVAIELIIVTY